jgi:DNA-binding response OmpR family regulator
MARRIALVEDDPTIRQNYSDALGRAGYEVASFGDRVSAMRALAARLPELAIIDIGLGADVDGGFELCRELRAGEQPPADHLPHGARFRLRHRLGACAWAPTTTSPRT